MPTYYCEECCRPTEYLNIQGAARYVGVTRATVYNWIKRSLVHTIAHPSGRTFVCVSSLLMSGTSLGSTDRTPAASVHHSFRAA